MPFLDLNKYLPVKAFQKYEPEKPYLYFQWGGYKVYVTANGAKKQVEVVMIFTADIVDMPISIEKYKTIEQ